MKRMLLLFLLLLNDCLTAAIPKYIEEWNEKYQSFNLIRDPVGQGDYLHPIFTDLIDKNQVHFILEIGSRDAIDAIDMSEFYKCHVCAFECNPQALEICHYNRNNNPNVTIVPYAAWNETKSITFYPVLPTDNRFNIGASSLYKCDYTAPDHYKQEEINVNAIRLDEWLENEKYETPDLLCIDAQGATLPILQGLGERLSQVKYIIAEVEIVQYYEGESLYPEVISFMEKNGFKEAVPPLPGSPFANILFINQK